MTFAKETLTRTGEFVSKHRVRIAVATTAVITTAACVALNRSAVKQWNEFLDEKGLKDEFYNSED
jgi:hypothetical protein